MDSVTKNAIYPKFKMAAAANMDFVKVPFLRGGWANSHQIWYAGATCSRKRDQNYHFWRNKMEAGAIMDFDKIAITLRRIEGFGSNFVYI